MNISFNSTAQRNYGVNDTQKQQVGFSGRIQVQTGILDARHGSQILRKGLTTAEEDHKLLDRFETLLSNATLNKTNGAGSKFHATDSTETSLFPLPDGEAEPTTGKVFTGIIKTKDIVKKIYQEEYMEFSTENSHPSVIRRIKDILYGKNVEPDWQNDTGVFGKFNNHPINFKK